MLKLIILINNNNIIVSCGEENKNLKLKLRIQVQKGKPLHDLKLAKIVNVVAREIRLNA